MNACCADDERPTGDGSLGGTSRRPTSEGANVLVKVRVKEERIV
jgi:hypothetical protein